MGDPGVGYSPRALMGEPGGVCDMARLLDDDKGAGGGLR